MNHHDSAKCVKALANLPSMQLKKREQIILLQQAASNSAQTPPPPPFSVMCQSGPRVRGLFFNAGVKKAAKRKQHVGIGRVHFKRLQEKTFTL